MCIRSNFTLIDDSILVVVQEFDRVSILILSIIEASVVDLLEPVGPVTSTRPRGFLQRSETTGGRPNASKVLISYGIERNTAPTAPFWLKRLARNRDIPFKPNEKSSSRFSSKRCFCASVKTEYAKRFVSAGVIGGKPASGDR